MAGARVLAGQPVPVYGQLCGPPPGPSLSALQGTDALWWGCMQRAIDYAFDITDATHPKLRLTGSLRPMVEQCWASLLLHYKEMHSEGELPGAIAKMRRALVMAGIATNPHLAHTVLVLYSDQIRAQLQRDQFADGCTATTHGSEPSMYTQVATVLQNLHVQMDSLCPMLKTAIDATIASHVNVGNLATSTAALATEVTTLNRELQSLKQQQLQSDEQSERRHQILLGHHQTLLGQLSETQNMLRMMQTQLFRSVRPSAATAEVSSNLWISVLLGTRMVTCIESRA